MWLTAISSINFTHSLIIYLHMNERDVAPQYTKLVAGRVQFKRFCKLNSMSKRAFFEINCFGLRYLYKAWTKKVEEIGEGNVPKLMGSFSEVMDEAKAVVHAVLTERIGDVN